MKPDRKQNLSESPFWSIVYSIGFCLDMDEQCKHALTNHVASVVLIDRTSSMDAFQRELYSRSSGYCWTFVYKLSLSAVLIANTRQAQEIILQYSLIKQYVGGVSKHS